MEPFTTLDQIPGQVLLDGPRHRFHQNRVARQLSLPETPISAQVRVATTHFAPMS